MTVYPDGWEPLPLEQAGKWLSGGTPSTSEPSYWGGDIPWISSGSLTSPRLWDSDRRVTPEGLAGGTRMVEPGAILMVVRGMSLKTEFRVGVAMRSVAFGQDCKALIPREGLLSHFLYYAIQAKAPEILGLVDEAGHGTGRLNTDQLQAVEIGLPPLGEQRAIAEVLGALDDKIAANTRLATTADRLSGAIYTAMLGDGVDAPLSGLADFMNGRAFTKGASGTGRVVVRIAELNSGIGASTVYSDADVADEYLARPGDMLFAWSGSLTLHRWFRPEAIVNQHIFKVIPRPDYPTWLVWHAIAGQLEYFRSVAADKATTMGHIQRRHLDESVSIPSRDSVATHDAEMTGLWDRALLAQQENLTLAATRDALLPALMSGALRVRDAERLAETLT